MPTWAARATLRIVVFLGTVSIAAAFLLAFAFTSRLTERYNLDLRLEAFGATNTPQFFFASNGGSANGTTLGSSSFGHVTNASGGRTLQLGIKFNF
jgi:hypothetical protein